MTPSLMKRVLGEFDVSGVHAINWGIVNEEGGKVFTNATGPTVDDCGLWLHKCGAIGASPDGMVGTDAILEISCPFTQRNCTIQKAIKSKTSTSSVERTIVHL